MTENPLGYEKISKLLKNFAVPSIVASLVGSIYNIVDQIFIGQGVGYLGNAATNVAYPFSTICLAIALLVGIGSASRVSLCLGRKEPKAAAKAAGNGIVLMGIFGIIYLLVGEAFLSLLLKAFGATTDVFPYAKQYASITLIGMPFLIVTNGMSNLIRADGKPKYSMVCMVVGAIINTILDPIFIFVFRWGIQGAALATIIGQIVSGVIALAYLPRFSHFAIRKKYLHLKWRFIGDIVRLGFPSLCTQTATAATQIVMNNLMRKYGAATIYGSEIALSCYGLMMKIYQIAHAMFVGLASGTQPINGFNFGARQYERVKQTIQTAAKISIGISVLWFLVFRYGGGFLAALFVEEEPLYQEFAVHCFRLYMLGFFVYGLPNVTASFFQAIGSPVKSLAVSLSRQVFFLIPFALLLSAHFGMDGALGAAPVADVLAFLLAALLLKRELRGWKKKSMIA